MHEVSVAESLAALIRRHLQTHQHLVGATVRIGPMHGVVPEALQSAWSVVSAAEGWNDAQLHVVTPPWRLRCIACGRRWTPTTIDEPCECGSSHADIVGGDEFLLESIEVETEPMCPASRRI
jgi:hydrogenase nickel incorporation protein HypA/HybF